VQTAGRSSALCEPAIRQAQAAQRQAGVSRRGAELDARLLQVLREGWDNVR